MKASKLATALIGLPVPGGGSTPGTNAVLPAPSVNPPIPGGAAKPASPMTAGSKSAPAPPTKIGHDVGALMAVKQAMRIGSTVPTGYKFNLQDEWLKGLGPEAQTQAQEKAKKLNEWLSQNSSVGSAYGQHPEFARTMIGLAQLAKGKEKIAFGIDGFHSGEFMRNLSRQALSHAAENIIPGAMLGGLAGGAAGVAGSQQDHRLSGLGKGIAGGAVGGAAGSMLGGGLTNAGAANGLTGAIAGGAAGGAMASRQTPPSPMDAIKAKLQGMFGG